MKKTIINFLAFISFIVNVIYFYKVEFFKTIDLAALVKGNIPSINTNDSYVVVLFEIFIYLIFFINVKRITSLPSYLGG